MIHVLSKKQITKALISLRIMAGWSAPMFRNLEVRFSGVDGHLIKGHTRHLAILEGYACMI